MPLPPTYHALFLHPHLLYRPLQPVNRLHALPRPFIAGIQIQRALEEASRFSEILEFQVRHPQVAEGKGIIGLQVQCAFERDDALRALARMEKHPSQTPQNLGIIGLEDVGFLQMPQRRGPLLLLRFQEPQDVVRRVAFGIQRDGFLRGSLRALPANTRCC